MRGRVFGLRGGKEWERVEVAEPAPTIRATQPSHYALSGSIESPALDKPPYSIPTLEEVRAAPRNGYTVVSTFSGAGGSCTGFAMAGFRAVYASEFVPAAADCYSANWPDTPVDRRDIRRVTGDDIRRIAGASSFDVMEGSPPCAAFSMSGARTHHWGEVQSYSEGMRQRTDDLFDEYIRLLRDVQPRVFVAENVAGIIAGKARGYFIRFRDRMTEAGFVVEARVLDAQWMGVPQTRKRLIFMGVRRDEWNRGMRHIWPTPLPYRYSIADAIGGRETTMESIVQRSAVVGEDVAPALAGYALDQHWASATGNHRKRLNLKRNPINGPVGTIVSSGGTSAGTASVVHPTERRKFSIWELKRLSSFPADYILPGTFGQQWERVGRAVPPLMMRSIARGIQAMLDG